MEQKSHYLIISVVAIILIFVGIWLFVLDYDGNTYQEKEGVELGSKKMIVEELTEEINMDEFEDDFSEIEKLSQELEEINVEEDIVPSL